MSFPKKLQHTLNRLSGWNQQTYKIMPLATDTISANKILSMRLPSSALVQMDSFSMFFDLETTSSVSGSYGRFPNKLSTFIEKVEVQIGGITLQAPNGYNVIRAIKDTVEGSHCKFKTRSVINHEEVNQNVDDFGNDITTAHEGDDI